MQVFDKNKRPLEVTSFIFENTYEGLIQGRPNKRLNDKILERVLDRPKHWPARPHISLSQFEETPHVLPLSIYHVWLTSESIDPKFMASDLMITWLGENLDTQSIQSIIQDATGKIIWEEWAEDFDY